MKFQSAPELFEVSLAFEQERMGITKRHLGETNSIAGTQLSGDRKVDCDHVRDLWIAADGLAIIEKQNWFAARRDLDCARRHRFRKKIALLTSFETRAVQSNSHSIRIWRHEKAFVVEELKCGCNKAIGIRTAKVTQDRNPPRGARPIVRWFPTRDLFGSQLFDQNFCARQIFAERKFLAIAHRPPFYATESSPQIPGSTTEYRGHIDSAGNREPGAASARRRVD